MRSKARRATRDGFITRPKDIVISQDQACDAEQSRASLNTAFEILSEHMGRLAPSAHRDSTDETIQSYSS